MGSPDFDYCELYVSVKGYFTGKPYIDTGMGMSSLNLPLESCTINDIMYEPKSQQMSTATVTFPTVSQNPYLIPILSNIQEGDRVEIYHFQPDCGLPVFAGFIPPGGITVQAGRMILDLQDVLGRGQWERIRPYEDFDTDALGYYQRAMSHWKDYMNEDFNVAATAGAGEYSLTYNIIQNGGLQITQNKFHVTADSLGINLSSNFTGSPLINLKHGDKVLVEARGLSNTDFVFQTPQAGNLINNQIGLTNGTDTIYLQEIISTDNGAAHAVGNVNRMIGVTANAVTSPANYTNASKGVIQTNALNMPGSHLYAMIFEVETDGSVTVNSFIDYINVVPPVNIPVSSLSGWYFQVNTFIPSSLGGLVASNTYQDWFSFRVRKLVPWILPASQFNPQTTDPTEFQANNDDLFTFLNNFVEIDFAEYRPIYQAWPSLDLLALDGVGNVGINASQRLGIDLLTDPNAPRNSGYPMGTDIGDFTNTPAFRFEEGFNLTDYPQVQKSQLTHANNIVRMGSGTTDAQNFYDRWNTAEVGNPIGQFFGTVSGASPKYPYFETLINDDRTSLPDVISVLADNDLLVRGAPIVPTVALQVADDIRYAFKYRAGDFARVKTTSLIPNVDQDLRIMNITHQAGSPTRQITVGRLPYDPSLRGLMAKSMVESWLYTQSGAGQLILIYPFVPQTLTAGSSGPIFQVPLNQFTSGTAITFAAFHWFTNGTDPVADIQVGISGPNDPSMANPSFITTAAGGQDSGLSNSLGYFPGPGIYYISPKNFGSASRQLNSLFLILKIKV